MSYIKQSEAKSIKKQLCAVFNDNGDWQSLANTLGIKRSTAYRWVNNQDDTLQRGGRRQQKNFQEHLLFISQCVEANSRITLKELKEKLFESFEVIVSKECLRKHLNGMLFSLKDLHRTPEKANSAENKTKRCDFVQKLLAYQAENMPICYMDETNFNLFISRRKGRSIKGTRCSYISAGCKGANVHTIGCISNMGVIHHEIRRGAFKKPEAMNFIRQCLRNAQTLYQSNIVLVIDNAPCHASIEEVFNEDEFVGHKLLRLGPYSPMFNAIENAWSGLKADVKRDLAIQMPEILSGEDRTNLSQAEYRLQRLESLLANNIRNITPEKCIKYIANVQRYIPDALNKTDVHF